MLLISYLTLVFPLFLDVTAVCILEGFQNQQSMLLADKVLKLLGKEKAKEKYKVNWSESVNRGEHTLCVDISKLYCFSLGTTVMVTAAVRFELYLFFLWTWAFVTPFFNKKEGYVQYFTWRALKEYIYIRSCQTMAYRPEPVCHLFLQIMFYWNSATHTLFLAAFKLQQQSWVVVTEAVTNIFTLWPFIESVCRSLFYIIKILKVALCEWVLVLSIQ